MQILPRPTAQDCVSASKYAPSETKNFNYLSCRSASGPQADSHRCTRRKTELDAALLRDCSGHSSRCAIIDDLVDRPRLSPNFRRFWHVQLQLAQFMTGPILDAANKALPDLNKFLLNALASYPIQTTREK